MTLQGENAVKLKELLTEQSKEEVRNASHNPSQKKEELDSAMHASKRKIVLNYEDADNKPSKIVSGPET
jgi:hypothetical protein